MTTFPRTSGKAVASSAVGAHRKSGLRDIEIDARVTRPQGHPRIGTIDGQVVRLDLDRVALADLAHRHTFVSHDFFAALRPLTVSKNSDCNFVVTGPRLPAPIGRLSYSRMGVTSAAVPVKKASSAR